MSLDEFPEIKLITNRLDRPLYSNLAEVFSIIKTTEHLETAYTRSAITPKEYEAECIKLIGQFKTLREAVAEFLPDIAQFWKDYKLNSPLAKRRLVDVGIPATREFTSVEKGSQEVVVAQAVQHFITTMDSLKLEMYAVDELFPHLSDLCDSLNKVKKLPPDHISKEKVKSWISTLNSMKASDSLSDDQARQMSFDLENGYSSFHKFLAG